MEIPDNSQKDKQDGEQKIVLVEHLTRLIPAIIEVLIGPDPNGLTLDISSRDGFQEPPTVQLFIEGQEQSSQLQVQPSNGSSGYTARIAELPPYVSGQWVVDGKTASGERLAAVEWFVLTESSAEQPVDIIGPSGAIVLHLPKVAMGERQTTLVYSRTLYPLTVPTALVMAGPPYQVISSSPNPGPVQLEYRLASHREGLRDTRLDPESLRLFQWIDATKTWKKVPSVWFASPWTMLTTKSGEDGIYAVFGRKKKRTRRTQRNEPNDKSPKILKGKAGRREK